MNAELKKEMEKGIKQAPEVKSTKKNQLPLASGFVEKDKLKDSEKPVTNTNQSSQTHQKSNAESVYDEL